MRNANKILVGKHERSNHLGDIDIDGRIILKCNLNKYDMRMWAQLIWLLIE
jgi:hypothetical protein